MLRFAIATAVIATTGCLAAQHAPSLLDHANEHAARETTKEIADAVQQQGAMDGGVPQTLTCVDVDCTAFTEVEGFTIAGAKEIEYQAYDLDHFRLTVRMGRKVAICDTQAMTFTVADADADATDVAVQAVQ